MEMAFRACALAINTENAAMKKQRRAFISLSGVLRILSPVVLRISNRIPMYQVTSASVSINF